MNKTDQIRAMKALEDMNLIDDFLFGEVMADEKNGLEACRIILSCVLKREVKNITFTAQKVIPGIRRIFLYVKGELSEEAGEDEKRLKNLLRYINESKDENVTDDNTSKLDEIVRHTKNKPGMGIKYMKSWERDRELIRDAIKDERKRTEEAEKRTEEAEKRAEEAEKRADNLQSELDAVRAELAGLKSGAEG